MSYHIAFTVLLERSLSYIHVAFCFLHIIYYRTPGHTMLQVLKFHRNVFPAITAAIESTAVFDEAIVTFLFFRVILKTYDRICD